MNSDKMTSAFSCFSTNQQFPETVQEQTPNYQQFLQQLSQVQEDSHNLQEFHLSTKKYQDLSYHA